MLTANDLIEPNLIAIDTIDIAVSDNLIFNKRQMLNLLVCAAINSSPIAYSEVQRYMVPTYQHK